MGAHHGDSSNIREVCCDISPVFISGVEKHFPEACLTFDKFHVLKIINEAVDEVRRLEPIKEAEYTIKLHWDGVLRWFTSKINNGILEGIKSLIQSAKAKARGYRTTKNLIAMIYLIGGKLEFRLPT